MKKLWLVSLLMGVTFSARSQTTYTGKIETGYLKFLARVVSIKPGPNWRGYYLNENQNGIDLNMVNGVTFRKKISTGLGIGYLNFAGISGVSAFLDIENAPSRPKWSPLFNVKVGYTHLWNQYELGSDTILFELNGGVFLKVKEKRHLYLKSGLMLTQQSIIVPIRMGLRF